MASWQGMEITCMVVSAETRRVICQRLTILYALKLLHLWGGGSGGGITSSQFLNCTVTSQSKCCSVFYLCSSFSGKAPNSGINHLSYDV